MVNLNYNALAASAAVRPPPRRTGPDFANAFAAGQRAQGAKLQKERQALALDEEKQRSERLKQRRQILATQDNMPKAVDQMMKAGDYEGAFAIADQHRKTIEGELKLVDMWGEHIKDEASYENLRGDLVRRGMIDGEELPAKYSDSVWAAKRNELKKKIDKVQTVVSRVQGSRVFMQQERVNADGEVVERGPEFLSPQDRANISRERIAGQRAAGKSAGKPVRMKAADTNAIRKAVERIFEPIIDPATGALKSPLQADDARKAQMLTDLASRIWMQSGGVVPHETAVRMAMQQAPQFVGSMGAIQPSGGPLQLQKRGAPTPAQPTPPLGSVEDLRRQQGRKNTLRPLSITAPKF